MPRLAQELLDDTLGLVVIALAKVVIANTARGVDEVMGRSIFVIEAAPDRVVVVDRDGIIDPQAFTAARTLSMFRSNANSGA
jgi:hypothetical protein